MCVPCNRLPIELQELKCQNVHAKKDNAEIFVDHMLLRNSFLHAWTRINHRERSGTGFYAAAQGKANHQPSMFLLEMMCTLGCK